MAYNGLRMTKKITVLFLFPTKRPEGSWVLKRYGKRLYLSSLFVMHLSITKSASAMKWPKSPFNVVAWQ